MKKFPRMYAESTIARMYKKLALPEETILLFTIILMHLQICITSCR